MSTTVHCASREEWLAIRRQDVTASEIAALVNVHPWVSPFELWAKKTGAIPAIAEETSAMRRGTYLESVAVRLVAEQMPTCSIRHNGADGAAITYHRNAAMRIGATPDVYVHDPDRGPGIVQIKSVEPSSFRRSWMTPAGDVEPPLWVGLQALTEANLTDAKWAAVAALRIGHGMDFDVVEIPLHDGAWARLVAAVKDFWELVEAGTPPPPDYNRDGKLLAALYPQDEGETIDLSADNEFVSAIGQRVALKAEAATLDKQIDAVEAEIRHKAGTAQRIIAGDWTVSLKTEHRREYTVPAGTRRPMRIKERRA